ncbi:MAG: hypothetical protein R3275_07695 [Saprospiraceae bacterium]|nr:hypothetical protein [Saprospiraceae bacterium]
MRKNNIYCFIISILIVTLFTSCQQEPYFSGGNQFKVETLAPEGIKVVGTLWYHNTTDLEGDHMSENLTAYVVGKDKEIPVNYGRDHVIRVGPRLRYDVPVVFYVPTELVTESVEEATLLANKSINKDIHFRIEGHGTILLNDEPVRMPVELEETISVWPDKD